MNEVLVIYVFIGALVASAARRSAGFNLFSESVKTISAFCAGCLWPLWVFGKMVKA